jgi:hypothetical protein
MVKRFQRDWLAPGVHLSQLLGEKAQVSNRVNSFRFSGFLSSILVAAGMLVLPVPSFAHIGIGISVNIAPPEMPVYEQPICPGDGYIWTPGYWAYGDSYYWVPGTWVMPPQVGFLWTPGYWGWGDGGYGFNAGYWGASVGFYGGINYGFGYFGHGYDGGRWDHGHFFYNTSVNHINNTYNHNVYESRVNETNNNRVSFNGGRGGVDAHATAQEEGFAHERHVGPVAAQNQHAWAAHNDPRQQFSANHGNPPVAATARANTAVHARDLPPVEHAAAPHSGNAATDHKYQQQQDKLAANQNRERQSLQQHQDKEDKQVTRQPANQARAQQTEQRHQQQTQQMQQRHTQQAQHMEQRQAPAAHEGGEDRGGRRK